MALKGLRVSPGASPPWPGWACGLVAWPFFLGPAPRNGLRRPALKSQEVAPRRRPLTWPTAEPLAEAPEASEASTAEPRRGSEASTASEGPSRRSSLGSGSVVHLQDLEGHLEEHLEQVEQVEEAVPASKLPAIQLLQLEEVVQESEQESSLQLGQEPERVVLLRESCFAMHLVQGKFCLGRGLHPNGVRNRSRVGFWWLE